MKVTKYDNSLLKCGPLSRKISEKSFKETGYILTSSPGKVGHLLKPACKLKSYTKGEEAVEVWSDTARVTVHGSFV
jgi:hypothetical protein